MDNGTGGQPEETIHLAHPLNVAAGQVIVDRDHMRALAGQGVQIEGRGRGQGLAFTGLHLGDPALMQDNAADQLHIVMPLAKHPAGGLANHGKGLRQQVVQRFPLGNPLPELDSLTGEFRVTERLNGRLQIVDPGHGTAQLFDNSVVFAAKNLGECLYHFLKLSFMIDSTILSVLVFRHLSPAIQISASSSQSGNCGQFRQSLHILCGSSR